MPGSPRPLAFDNPMQHRSLAVLFTVGSALTAQQAFVVPSKANLVQPGLTYFDSAPQSFPLWGTTSTSSAARTQYLYDTSDIPIAGGLLNSLAVRAPVGYSISASSYTTQITMSMGPNTSTTASSQYAANHGSPTTVLSGQVNMPQGTSGTWPRPWQTPITFLQPFSYLPALGSSLVIEFETTASGNQTSWSIEGYRAEIGNSGSELYQGTCRHSGGGTSGGWGWSSNGLVPGGSLVLNLSGYPINAPQFATNILFISTGGLGSQIGPFITPFDLNLIVPSPATCRWAIDIANAITVPMVYRQYTTSAQLELTPSIPIPNHRSLGNKVLYTQNLALDFDAQQSPVLFPSIAIRWLIGPNTQIPASVVRTIYNPVNPPPASGTLVRSEAASLQLNY